MDRTEQEWLEDYYLRRLLHRDYLRRLGDNAMKLK
jgi:hypothetical protein